jgi:hypothetical protein
MNKSETLSLLNLISDVDGRVVTSDMVTTWTNLFSRFTYAETEKAFYEAAANLSGRRLAPGDLISRISTERNRVEKVDYSKGMNWDFCPACEPHGVILKDCRPCTQDLARRYVCIAHKVTFVKCFECKDNGIYTGMFLD